MSVRLKPLPQKMPELQCCWHGFLRKHHYVLLPCNSYPQTSSCGLIDKFSSGLKLVKYLQDCVAHLNFSKSLKKTSVPPKKVHSQI